MYKYAVLGAGRQGQAIAYDLSEFGNANNITIIDIDKNIAEKSATRLNTLLNRGALDNIPVFKNTLLNSSIFQLAPVFIVNPGNCTQLVSVNRASSESIVYC